MKRNFIYLFILLAAFSFTKTKAQTKPNIIYILADDLGYGDVSCLNENAKLKTVFIDALAKKGMKFTDAHSSSAVCTPTRYGILTGRYNWRTTLQKGVLGGFSKPLISKETYTVANLLKDNGYYTACVGKWHLGLNWQTDSNNQPDITKPITDGPINHGFDYFFGIPASLDMPPYVYVQNDKITATKIDSVKGSTGKQFWREGQIGNDFKHSEVLDKVTEKATSFIKTQSESKKPFFLYFPLPAPHTPILPSAQFVGKSNTTAYGDFVLMVDEVVGKIVKSVKDAGLESNTIIVFTSDNGCSPEADFKELEKFGHDPSYIFRGEKADLYEGGHHIPFIVSWPGKVKPNTASSQTICLTDLISTCSSILNKKLPDNAGPDSYSLVPLLIPSKNAKYMRGAIVSHSISGHFAIRQQNWKLLFSKGSGGWSYPTPKETKNLTLPNLQLFDLSNDIEEKNNIAEKHPEIVKRLTLLMEQYIANGRSTPGSKQQNDAAIVLMKDSL